MTLSNSLTFKCAAAAVLTGLSLAAAAGPITIANASFELQNTPNFTINNANAITSWTQSSVFSGVQRPSAVGGGAGFIAGVTGGQTAYINGNGSSISQTLSSILQLGTYSLLVDVGDRSDFDNPLYAIELLAGSSVLGIINQTNFATPVNTTGGWVTAQLNYTALAGNTSLGQALGIRLSNTSTGTGTRQVNFDNVRLTFDAPVLNNVPEPGSLVLVGLALAAAGTVASRRRHGGAAS